ncbi:MAG: flagellar filament capping protein FliD [Pelomonas sp.]|nr:flagellar filament capping protein FliD [Roseateles sp.]
MVASINSPGIGSGLDVKGIVDKLVAVERRPITLLQQQHSSLQARLSSFGLLKSYLGNLGDAATQLSDLPLWRTPRGTSSDPSTVALTTSDGGSTTGGNYSVQVVQLAQGQTVASTPVADATAAVGAGTLHIELGRWPADGGAFVPQDGAAPVDLSFTAGDSLETVRDRINAAQAGLAASLISDASGTRLVVHSTATGAANGFRITAGPGADGTPAPAGLRALAYAPGGADGGTAMRLTQAAQNAHATVNGVAIDAASNVVDGAIAGVTLSLLKAGGDAVNVSLKPDTDAIAKAINGFVGAINDLAKYIAAQTKYDAATKTGAALQGDTTTLQIQKAVRKAMSDPTSASSTFPRLLDIGIKLGSDNLLTIDNTKLQAALANPAELARALGNRTSDSAADGLAVHFKHFAQTLLGTDGLVSTRNQALADSAQRNLDQQAQLESHVTSVQARLLQQYQALDKRMATLSGQSSYVSQQMQLLLKQK